MFHHHRHAAPPDDHRPRRRTLRLTHLDAALQLCCQACRQRGVTARRLALPASPSARGLPSRAVCARRGQQTLTSRRSGILTGTRRAYTTNGLLKRSALPPTTNPRRGSRARAGVANWSEMSAMNQVNPTVRVASRPSEQADGCVRVAASRERGRAGSFLGRSTRVRARTLLGPCA